MAAISCETTLHTQGRHVSQERTAMNFKTISNSANNSNWKRIKGQYLAAVAGVALAISAVVAFGPSAATSNQAAPVRPATAVTADAQVQRQASDADIMAGVLSSELANFAPLAPVARVTQADIDASVLSTEMAAYEFVPEQTVKPAQRQAFDADIMAGVIRPERAAFG